MPERRRALELLAASPDGCSEAIMLAHGFTVDFLVDLIRTGMATTRTERVVAGGRAMEVARVRITEGGIAVAAFGAIVGDNAGYWLGLRYGYALLGRFVALLRILAAFLAG